MNSGGGGDGDGGGRVVGMGTALRSSSPFTVSQWQELEHQALIFKYMKAGLPVPPDLVLPIQKSFESLSHRFFHHPTMAYCSLYGKKVDPEPGRCRRTDGKKWRCSKDAYPDSKYCERHMHRGRNRSRKPVESQTMTQSSSSVTSLTVSGSTGGTGSFQNLPFSAFGVTQVTDSGPNQSPYLVDNIPYGIPSKDFRYLQGIKAESGEYSFLTEASASNRAIPVESALENAWPVLQSNKVSLYHQKSGDNCILQTEYPQHSFFNGEFNSGETANKPEGQPLRPFFDEWPKSRDSWPSLAEDRSNLTSFSTTQLSISIPMASSEFSASSSHPSHGEYKSPSQLMSGSIIRYDRGSHFSADDEV